MPRMPHMISRSSTSPVPPTINAVDTPVAVVESHVASHIARVTCATLSTSSGVFLVSSRNNIICGFALRHEIEKLFPRFRFCC